MTKSNNNTLPINENNIHKVRFCQKHKGRQLCLPEIMAGNQLKEFPKFIKNVLMDIKKDTNMVIRHIESISQQLSGSIPEVKMPLLPITTISEQVSVQYLMADAESTCTIYDLLPEKSNDLDSVSINEQENSLIVEGTDPKKLTGFLENNLDGETFCKMRKVSTFYEGHPIKLIRKKTRKVFS